MNKQERMEQVGKNIKGSTLHNKPNRSDRTAFTAWKDEGVMFGRIVCIEAFKDDEGKVTSTWPGVRASMVAYEANMSIEKIMLTEGVTVRRSRKVRKS